MQGCGDINVSSKWFIIDGGFSGDRILEKQLVGEVRRFSLLLFMISPMDMTRRLGIPLPIPIVLV